MTKLPDRKKIHYIYIILIISFLHCWLHHKQQSSGHGLTENFGTDMMDHALHHTHCLGRHQIHFEKNRQEMNMDLIESVQKKSMCFSQAIMVLFFVFKFKIEAIYTCSSRVSVL